MQRQKRNKDRACIADSNDPASSNTIVSIRLHREDSVVCNSASNIEAREPATATERHSSAYNALRPTGSCVSQSVGVGGLG